MNGISVPLEWKRGGKGGWNPLSNLVAGRAIQPQNDHITYANNVYCEQNSTSTDPQSTHHHKNRRFITTSIFSFFENWVQNDDQLPLRN